MEYKNLVQDVRTAFHKGTTRPVEWRIQQLNGLLRMYEENEDLFNDALHKDLRKPKWESVSTEINFLKNDIIGCLRDIEEWTKEQATKKNLLTILDSTIIRPEPFGVVLIIGSWNYPLHISLAPLAGAIAAGNCAIVKPSEISPHSASVIEQLLPRYINHDCFKVVTGGVSETTELLKERFDYIFYTGSTNVGKIIREAANRYLTPCTLELGGKSPVYISDDCNIKVAAKRILWGKIINLGQTCIAPDYVLCSRHIEAKFVEESKKILTDWLGNQPQNSPDLCRIVSDRHFDRLVKLMETSTGKAVVGGTFDEFTRYMDVTLLSGVSPQDTVMQEEIFGPILPIINVKSPTEAIDFINAREKPLTLYVYSENKHIQELFMSQTSSGGMAINECLLQMSVESLPFGGVGSSGMGAYHGKASFDTFTHYKSILIRDLGYVGEKVGEMRYPPYNDKRLDLLSNLLKNRKLPDLGFVGYGISFAVGAVSMLIGKVFTS